MGYLCYCLEMSKTPHEKKYAQLKSGKNMTEPPDVLAPVPLHAILVAAASRYYRCGVSGTSHMSLMAVVTDGCVCVCCWAKGM